MTLAEITGDASSLTEQIKTLLMSALPNLITAGVILVIGTWLSARVERSLRVMLARQKTIDGMLGSMLARLGRYVVLVIVLVSALGQLGIQTTSLLAALGAIGLAVGLALQGTLANVAAGIMLLWLRPFKIGDYVEVDAQAGTVRDVGLFATSMTTIEGLFVFVPNAELWNKRLTNYSRMPQRMVREIFTISYDDDIRTAREVLLGLTANDPRVHTEPPPIIRVVELGDNAVSLEMRAWTDTGDYLQTKCDLIEHGKTSLEAAGLSIPYPQRDVHIHNDAVESNEV